MKSIIAGTVLAVTTLAANASPAEAVAAYKGALYTPYSACQSAYSSAQLDQQLAGMLAAQARRNYGTPRDSAAEGDAMIAAARAFGDCKSAARAKALDAYKAFAAGLPDGKFKADGRTALTAWLAFLSEATGDVTLDTRSDAQTAYLKALAELDVDAAGL